MIFMILMIIFFILVVIGFVGSVFSAIEYFHYINNDWKTPKQVSDEYMSCLAWGWISLMGVAVFGLCILGYIIGFVFYIC